METKIKLAGVASYTEPTTLETDKQINLIYGLNGTGKSVLSDYLRDPDQQKYTNCSIKDLPNETRRFVYNQNFIKNNFYESETLQGIFTLSEKNKGIEENIITKTKELNKHQEEKAKKESELTKIEEEISDYISSLQKDVWKIKSDYADDDKILEFCLERLKASKETLLKHIILIPKPDSKPIETVEYLKKETQLLEDDNARTFTAIPEITLELKEIEENELLKKKIEGDVDNEISRRIQKLNNSDWMKKGLSYLLEPPLSEEQDCPFCHSKTITDELLREIHDCFDESYRNDVTNIKKMRESYENERNKIPAFESDENIPFLLENKQKIQLIKDALTNMLDKNLTLIKEKEKRPSSIVSLDESTTKLKELNNLIKEINENIKEHNNKFSKKQEALDEIKKEFWQIMRWEHDPSISIRDKSTAKSNKEKQDATANIEKTKEKIHQAETDIQKLQKGTVNIDEAILSINGNLAALGMSGFKIEKHEDEDNKYQLSRENKLENTFKTLSEGEKMIISFLYFMERCKGKTDEQDISLEKIVVIDDPISSLSHIYVFNIASFIKQEFFENPNIKQTFVLTHSLYFFSELARWNGSKKKLFRITKNEDSSSIDELKADEIQNDYQAYWRIIKEPNQAPQLIANCMRNIIEYYFGFVEGSKLKELFGEGALETNKYAAFLRYMNRESHSDAQNMYDFKEFDYDIFLEAFRHTFSENGHEQHYNLMMDVKDEK